MLRRQENRLPVLNTENLMAYQFGNNKGVDSTRWLCQLRNQARALPSPLVTCSN